jgi:AMMECR1 domain-containing protein
VGVSLLVNFQEGKKALDWEVGKHGIIIKSNHKGRYYQATYLPEVAAEYSWSRE